MNRAWGAAGLLVLVSCSAVWAASDVSKDIEGSKDHPLLKRYEGAVIVKYSYKEFDDYTVPLRVENRKVTQSLQAQGEVTRLYYWIPLGRSAVEVMRNYESELKEAGYKVLFSATPEEAKSMSKWIPQINGEVYLPLASGKSMVVWKLIRPAGDVHVLLAAAESGPYNSPFKRGQTILRVDVVTKKAMDEGRLVKVGA
jgi:hypothetical protein